MEDSAKLMPVEQVTISKREYDSLIFDAKKLNALEAAGVDNWEWYGDAMEPLYEDDE